MMDALRDFFEQASLMVRFIMALGLVLLAPRLFERFKLPGILALILAGIFFGPKGARLFTEESQTLINLAVMGKLLLLFFSGLDVEWDVIRKNVRKSFRLAAWSFLLPAAAGFSIGLIFHYNLLTSAMIAVLFSSHSIIAYPILSKLGLQKYEPVAVTIGATAITDIASLILLAICLPIHTTGFQVGPFLLQIAYIVVFIPSVIFGFQWLGKVAFRHLDKDPAEQMIFLLLVVGISAEAADLAGIEPVVGAFLAGLAVGTTLPEAKVRNQLEVLGNTLFIPAFFISLGMLIDPAVVRDTLRDHFAIVATIVGTVLITKMSAAWFAGGHEWYTRKDRLLVGSLTLPQVSSTLAVALVAYESLNAQGERLIDAAILNSILVLMVGSSIAGMILTEYIARKISTTTPADTAVV
ncbi:MAG TPA: cation:proton antiporter [Cyclobacteriaceae bacterium]|nr:cation:proton antiporter [Cyclobacteriaceae bacterium]